MKIIVLLGVVALISVAWSSLNHGEKELHAQKRFIRDTFRKVKQKVTKVVDKTTDTFKNIGQKTKETIVKIGEKTKGAFVDFGAYTKKKFEEVEKKTKELFIDFGNKVKSSYLTIARKISSTARDVGRFVTKSGQDFGHFFESFGQNAVHFFVKVSKVVKHAAADVLDYCRTRVLELVKNIDWEMVIRTIIPYIDSSMSVYLCTLAIKAIITAIVGPASAIVGILIKFLCKAALHLVKMGAQLLVDHYYGPP